MAQLAHPVETITEVIVAKSVAYAKLLLLRYTNFKLVLRPRICYDLPVVLTIHERSVWDHRPKEIVGLVKESVATVSWESDLFGWIVDIPAELMNVQQEVKKLIVNGLVLNFGILILDNQFFVLFLMIKLSSAI